MKLGIHYCDGDFYEMEDVDRLIAKLSAFAAEQIEWTAPTTKPARRAELAAILADYKPPYAKPTREEWHDWEPKELKE